MNTFNIVDGVVGIDFELFDVDVGAVYLIDDEKPTLIDSGTAANVDTIIDGLTQYGFDPTDLSTLVLSHIHIDHSGGASALVEAAPDLDVYIHESTVDHLADPTGLVKSSRQAMGKHFDLMGEQGPVPRENIISVPDEGVTIELGSTTLELIHGPGHSPDHLAVWNPERKLLFAGECLGYYFPRADKWVPPATMPNFDVNQVADTIEQLRKLDPEQIIFPHFGEWPHEPETAFDTADAELHRFDERIVELYDKYGNHEETANAVGEELLDLSPPYNTRVQSFYQELLTAGFLQHHGLA